MPIPHNYIDFPQNVLVPEKKIINDDEYTVYGFRFQGLQDFYHFLKQPYRINSEVFDMDDLSSITGKKSFAGKPFKSAVEDLVRDVDPKYREYLSIQKQMKGRVGTVHKYQQMKNIAGGSVDPVAYTVGSPEIYRMSRVTKRPKYITIDTQVGYYWGTSFEQVFHRAVIITNLIHALERNGYDVNVNSFMAAENGDEIIQAIFEVKKHGKRINYQTLYKSLVNVEFFRRLCFRLIEISDVESDWKDGYGRSCSEDLARKLLNLEKEDIYFDQPRDMCIEGEDIKEDFRKVINYLGLEDIIDVEKETENIERGMKVLTK